MQKSRNGYKRAWTQKQRMIRQDFADQFKKDGCLICGEKDPCCLQFHHLNPKEKSIEVSKLVNQKAPITRIAEEIEKCVVLCANCHAKFHAGRFDIPRM